MRIVFSLLALLYLLPIVASALLYWIRGADVDWRSADRSSSRLLPMAQQMPEAVVRVFSARTVSWRGIIATHSWIVIKDADSRSYERFDYTAWGDPIWKDRFIPDGLWFGNEPEVVFAADGAAAARMIPSIRDTIGCYRYPRSGDYRIWPGPNSNTFVAAIMQAVSIKASLPSTAIGKDFPYDGRWIGWTPSKTGVRLNLGGYFGIAIGWYEGIELNLVGLVAGMDVRRLALKLPAVGRLGVPVSMAIILPAPANAAALIVDKPTPPQPITATISPALTLAVCMTDPKPVRTAQPINAARSNGMSRRIDTQACS